MAKRPPLPPPPPKARQSESKAESGAREEVSDLEDPPLRPSLPASDEPTGEAPPPIARTPAAREPSVVVAPQPIVKIPPKVMLIPEPSTVPTSFDPECMAQGRHRANCDCKGSARAPIEAA